MEIIIWTDGSCINNGRSGARASYARYFGDGDRRNTTWNLCTQCSSTNNIAELCAVDAAMKYIDRYGHKYPNSFFTVCTDSQYVIDCIERWGPMWERRNWINSKGNEVANRKYIEPLYYLYNDLRDDGVDVELRKVSAHSGVYENDRVDEMAYQGACDNDFVCGSCMYYLNGY